MFDVMKLSFGVRVAALGGIPLGTLWILAQNPLCIFDGFGLHLFDTPIWGGCQKRSLPEGGTPPPGGGYTPSKLGVANSPKFSLVGGRP